MKVRNAMTLNSFNLNASLKIIGAFAVLVSLFYLGTTVETSQVLSLLSKNGVNVPDGLAEGLAAANTVGDVNALLATAAGVSVAPWLAAAIAGVGAASL